MTEAVKPHCPKQHLSGPLKFLIQFHTWIFDGAFLAGNIWRHLLGIRQPESRSRMDSAAETHNTASNLTPQFNTMIHSMMSIKSPQLKQSPSMQVNYGHLPLQVINSHEVNEAINQRRWKLQ